MPISEKKMQIVMNNYFNSECDINTSIREAFEKGFRIGVQKGYETTKPAEITLESAIDYLQSTGWLQMHDQTLTVSSGSERKKGELKTVGFLTCQCSECGVQFHELEYTNYCPKCGAKWSE